MVKVSVVGVGRTESQQGLEDREALKGVRSICVLKVLWDLLKWSLIS